ncbi:DNA-binding transcriptional regulator, LysR family [Cribrihabitans marinus]|jgi:DNA-binding transcriptional LysR family regulator|uniref:DNA-binding transcriptional regulator, LysR family n=1 Tax=Cribrihabitans marinus TaxID=1227549 RepID=A0A1H7E182_9RHOB|nr:LysR family transcriptional regulator [Cribrihabitans marinus]GGH41715.1 LysR family transcriptional regulator [Cribrihabitans marinus]SEK07618.1 DNA-binding transcriptional regulator, LysR family [Cribrihabitans marinus]
MDIDQIRCFLAVADSLHFGRAAQSLDMLPASLSRQIRLLEDKLETRLFLRTTRSVSLTEAGASILEEARALVAQAEKFEEKVRNVRKSETPVLKVGAIDSAAAGLMPQLLSLVRQEQPGLEIQLIEQKTIRLLPKLLSGSLDIAFCRPPDIRDQRINFQTLFFETAVVALPEHHSLADHDIIEIADLADEPLIVPDRRSRPHSHDLTIKLFLDAGLTARIAQVAEEKHTIVNLVAAGTGLAIVPRWTSRLQVPGVTFVPLSVPEGTTRSKLILAAAWARGTRDPARDAFVAVLEAHLKELEASA